METLVSACDLRCVSFRDISPPSGLQFPTGMSCHGGGRESALVRLARLNEALAALIAERDASDSLSSDAARQLAATIERLLGCIADMRQNPARNTPERLHALADALAVLLAEIAGTPERRV